jgi:hypothetical protein
MRSSQRKLWNCFIPLSLNNGNIFTATSISHNARLRIYNTFDPMRSLGKAFEINVKLRKTCLLVWIFNSQSYERIWIRLPNIMSVRRILFGFVSVTYKYFFFYVSWGVVRLSPLGTSATKWPIAPTPDDRWVWSSGWYENWQGKPKYSEKTCPSATLSTTNPTWSDLDSNPGRCGGKSATNRLSYSTASCISLTLQET